MLANGPDLFETRYDRAKCAAGVLHLGFGAFHRAHQAVYFDDYMQATGDLRWGIIAVNLRAAEAANFAQQAKMTDGYIVKAMAPDGDTNYRRVRSHVGFADWSADAAGAEALLASDAVHLVTVTVTESGYYTTPTGQLNATDPTIAAEAAGGAAKTVYGYLAAALARRMQAGGGPLTIMCCDNIRQNGKMLHRNLAAYLTLCGKGELAAWVEKQVTFPCSMVDRITPRPTAQLQHDVEAIFGQSPAQPIMAEAFLQWVVEDNFAGPAPDLAAVDVTITADVDPYEEAKIRILNGGHTALVYLAALHGYQTFDQAMRDPALFAHLDSYERQEVLPGLTIELPFDKATYLDAIAARFCNAAIADSVERICADGVAKFPIFVRPTLESCLNQAIIPENGFRAVASWYVFARHVAAKRMALTYLEPSWDLLQPLIADGAVDQFTHSTLLWADLPATFPDFAPLLRDKIIEMETSWPL